MSTTLAAPDRRRLPLREGDYITFTAGRTAIRVQCIRPGEAYSVVVEQGSYRVEDQCGSYPTEDLAREVARSFAKLAILEVTP